MSNEWTVVVSVIIGVQVLQTIVAVLVGTTIIRNIENITWLMNSPPPAAAPEKPSEVCPKKRKVRKPLCPKKKGR